MAKIVQQYGLTANSLAEFLGEERQVIVNMTRWSLHIMDGVLPGGYEMALANLSNAQAATNEQDGKMTADHVLALEEATDDIAALDEAVAAVASLAGGKVAKVGSITVGHMALFASGGELKTAGMPFFAENTMLPFGSALPGGWTLDTTFNDRFLLTTTTSGDVGQTGGDAAITGLTFPHTHMVEGDTGDESPDAATNGQAGVNADIAKDHTHPVAIESAQPASDAITSDGNWKPPYVKIIWGKRAAIA